MEGPPQLRRQTAAPARLRHIEAPDVELASALIGGGLLREEDLDILEAAWAERGGGYLSDILLSRGLISELNLLRFFAARLRTRFVTAEKLAAAHVDPAVLDRLSVRDAEALGALPLWWDEKEGLFSCIVALPLNGDRLAKLQALCAPKKVQLFVATWSAIAAALRKHYYRNAEAFAEFSEQGAAPPPQKVPKEPLPGEREEKTRVLFQNERANIVALRQENLRYRIAQEFHRRVQVLNDLPSQIEAVVELCFDLLSADTVVVDLQDGIRAFRSNLEAPDIHLPKSLLEEARRSPGGLLRNGIGLDGQAHSESVMLRGIKSAMVVPLKNRDEELGFLYVESTSTAAAFDQNDLAIMLSVAAQASTVIQNARLLARVEREAGTRTQLSRFLPPELVDQAVVGELGLELGGRSTQATILYADIRGFTRATEALGANEIVRLLGQFYEEMSDVVFETHGMVDKFMGDCIMAVWGAPIPRADHAQLGLWAAASMLHRAKKIMLDGVPLKLGIGLASGDVVVGAIGGKRRMDYTVIGPAVNVASRLCDLARAGQVFLTDATKQAGGETFQLDPLPSTELKGVEEELSLFSLRLPPLATLSTVDKIEAPTPSQAETPHDLAAEPDSSDPGLPPPEIEVEVESIEALAPPIAPQVDEACAAAPAEASGSSEEPGSSKELTSTVEAAAPETIENQGDALPGIDVEIDPPQEAPLDEFSKASGDEQETGRLQTAAAPLLSPGLPWVEDES